MNEHGLPRIRVAWNGDVLVTSCPPAEDFLDPMTWTTGQKKICITGFPVMFTGGILKQVHAR